MVTKGRKKGTVRFAMTPGDGAGEVRLAGDFNHWRPVPMRKRKDGEFVAVVAVAPGTYEYKFLIDGQWTVDRDNHDWASNPFGGVNSVAVVE